MLKMLKRAHHLLKPQVILPVLLAAALLVFAFRLGDLGKVVAGLRKLSWPILLIALACAAGYLGCKALQLRLMLEHAGVRIPPRPFWLAFAVGEMTVTLPLGLFSQNWVMSASRRIDVGRSSSATVMMLLSEIAVVFLFLAVAGIPGWSGVRYGAIGALVFFVSLVATLLLFENKAREWASRMHHDWAKRAAASGVELIDGLRRLTTPHTLLISVLLAAVYLGALTTAFWTVGRGMHLQRIDYLDATQIYIFALAVILIGAGLISQIGTVDLLGMAVARSFGINYTEGLSLMLGFRIVWTGSIWVWCAPIVAATWREIPSHGKHSGDGGKKSSD